jgi:hypothetical protein
MWYRTERGLIVSVIISVKEDVKQKKVCSQHSFQARGLHTEAASAVRVSWIPPNGLNLTCFEDLLLQLGNSHFSWVALCLPAA